LRRLFHPSTLTLERTPIESIKYFTTRLSAFQSLGIPRFPLSVKKNSENIHELEMNVKGKSLTVRYQIASIDKDLMSDESNYGFRAKGKD